ncbi:MAG: class I SAM-dependent methyltransferase [Anaerolineales bacterium]|nr:class I SAM-dependent methyltransferase [Anaerolineales bacterium]
MTNSDPEDRKRRLAEHFDAVSSTYDGLNFLQVTARRFVELANLSAGMSVLDIATGTGIVPLLAAESLGTNGRVVGIDISEEMIAIAKQKTSAITNLQLLTGDAENLGFENESFDAALCASSLFFVPDMTKALKEARRVLKPNGFILFNSFEAGFLQPLRELWSARLQKHNVKLGSLPIHRLPDSKTCEQLLRDTGFTKIDVKVEQLGYYLPTEEDRWREIVSGLEGAPLKKMSNEQRGQIHAEHVVDLQDLVTPKGIWVDVPPIFAFGR